MKRDKCLVIFLFVCSVVFCSCSKKEKRQAYIKKQKKEVVIETEEDKEQKGVADSELEKGYDLPVTDQDRNEAEQDSYQMMTLIADIYQNADKGSYSNIVLRVMS